MNSTPSLVVSLLAVLISACTEPPSETPTRPLRIGVYTDTLSLDPHRGNEVITFSINSHLFESLVTFDGNLGIQPALAESWSTPDDLTWRFHLRPNVRFHDNAVLTARDVTHSFDRARTLEGSEFAGYLGSFSSYRAIDDSTIEITTERPYSVLLNNLAFVLIVGDREHDDLIGTGPYELASHVVGKRIELSEFSSYWGSAPAHDAVEFVVVDDDHRRVDEMLEGNLDLVVGVAAEDIARIEDSTCCSFVSREGLAVTYLEPRLDIAPLSSLDVRRAIDLAIDRLALIDSVLAGHGRPAGQLVASAVIGFDPTLTATERDLDRARELLRAAGFADGLELEVEFREGGDIELLAAQLAEAGITLRPIPRSPGELYQRVISGQFELFLAGVVSESGDASDILHAMAHSRDPDRGYGDANLGGYSNAALDSLIERSALATKPLERRELLQDCMRLWMADLPAIPLYVPNQLHAARSDLVWIPRLDGTILATEVDEAEL